MAPVGRAARDTAAVALALDEVTDVARHRFEQKTHRKIGETEGEGCHGSDVRVRVRQGRDERRHTARQFHATDRQRRASTDARVCITNQDRQVG